MKERTVVASISIAIIAALVAFAYHPHFQLAVAGLVATLTAIALWEYEQFAQAKGVQTAVPPLIVLGVLVIFSFFVTAKFGLPPFFPALFFFVAFLCLFAIHFRRKDGALVDLAVSTFGLLYIAVPMGILLAILYMPPSLLHQDGRWWLAYLLIVTKITDIGGYFGGSLWGRRKLAPTISPKKTVEGAAVGLLCALVASLLFVLLSRIGVLTSFDLQWGEALGLGLLFGIIGQFGDLSESLLKRDANKKDSNALPGLGGALDSIDSLLFNAPILYFYLHALTL